MEDKQIKFTYFQLYKELEIPVFIRCDLSSFKPELLTFLKQHNFTEISENETKELVSRLGYMKGAKVLTLKVANATVTQQIEGVMEGDSYGPESVIPKRGYKVYRYKHMGIMVYSAYAAQWELGVIDDFASEAKDDISRIIINRYIGLALSGLGIVGFWGVPVDEGVVVLRASESKGEAIYIDVKNQKVLSIDGVDKMDSNFKILKLDGTLKDRTIKMKYEELLSFLSLHSTFIDYGGLTVPCRQLIQAISKVAEGCIYPRENFKPRTDLSL